MVAIYVAYAAADRDRGLELVSGLRTAGLTVRSDHRPAGDSAWWSDIVNVLNTSDVLLYATSTGADATPVVARLHDYARGRGLRTVAVLLAPAATAKPGDETVVDFSKRDAHAAFELVGALAALPAKGRATAWGPSPESPFARVEELAHATQALLIEHHDQRTLIERLHDAAPVDPAAVPELAEVLRHRTDLDPAARTLLDDLFPPAGHDPHPALDGFLTEDAVREVGFHKPSTSWRGYDERSVDDFLDLIEQDLRTRRTAAGPISVTLTAADVRSVRFARPPFGRRGYDQDEVDTFLSAVEQTFTTLDATLTRQGTPITKL